MMIDFVIQTRADTPAEGSGSNPIPSAFSLCSSYFVPLFPGGQRSSILTRNAPAYYAFGNVATCLVGKLED